MNLTTTRSIPRGFTNLEKIIKTYRATHHRSAEEFGVSAFRINAIGDMNPDISIRLTRFGLPERFWGGWQY